MQFGRPRKTKLARFARSEIGSRCTPFACSTTTRRATIVTFSIYVRSLPRARCLTLALAPNGAGPGSHLGFTEVTLGCPLATRARVGRLTTLERRCSNPPLLVARTVWRARVRHQGKDGRYRGRIGRTSRRFAPRFGTGALRPARHRVCHLLPMLRATAGPSSAKHSAWPVAADGREVVVLVHVSSPGLTERTLARSEPCADAPLVAHRLRFAPSAAVRPDRKLTASALFRPHRWPDSSAFRPLHSLPHSASPTSLDALAHSVGRKLPRPALTAARPKMQSTEAARLRPARTQQYGARLRLSPRTKQ